jgi:hypothetical protein
MNSPYCEELWVPEGKTKSPVLQGWQAQSTFNFLTGSNKQFPTVNHSTLTFLLIFRQSFMNADHTIWQYSESGRNWRV